MFNPVRSILSPALLMLSFLAFQPAWADCDSGPGGPPACTAPGPASPAKTGAPDTAAGNPLNVITGNKYQREVDLPALPGVLGLEIVRHYNSANSGVEAANGLLGRGWKLSYETELVAVGNTLQVLQADGGRLIFNRDPANPSHCSSGDPANGSIAITRNGQGREEFSWTWTDGRKLSFNASGKLVQIAAASGEFVSLHYDNRNVLLKVVDPQGRTLSLAYLDPKTAKGQGRFAGVQHIDSPAGRFSYAYGSPPPKDHTLADTRVLWATLVSVTAPAGGAGTAARLYHYENREYPTLLTGISIAEAGAGLKSATRYASYGYDHAGRAVLSTHAGNVGKVTLAFPAKDTTILTNSLGQSTVYRHAIIGTTQRLLEVRGAGCSSCGETNVRYAYDTSGRLLQATRLGVNGEPLNTVTTERDQFGRVTKVSQLSYDKGKAGQPQWLIRYAYAEDGSAAPILVARPSVVADKESITRISYNGKGQALTLSEQGWAHAHDAAAPPTPIERHTRYRYSMLNNRSVLTEVSSFGPGTDSTPRATAIKYDELANYPIEIAAPGNQAVRIVRRDQAGRPLRIVAPGGLEFAYELDPAGRVTKLGIAGTSEHFSYDALGQLVGVIQATGQRIAYAYAADGRLREISDVQGNRIRIERDTEARLVARTLLNPDGSVAQQSDLERFAPDPEQPAYEIGAGSHRSAAVGEGNAAADLASNDGRPEAFASPDAAVSHFSYERVRRLTQVTDARRLSSAYVYDDFGRLTRLDSPDGGSHVFAYDIEDHVLSKTSGYGTAQAKTIVYRYDAAGRVIEQLAPEGKTTIAYAATGRPSRIAFPGGEERYEYDAGGRLASHTRIIDGQSFTTRYAYDERGQARQKTLPDGQVLSYHYNGPLHPKAGLLAKITRQDLFGKTVLLQGLNDADDGYANQHYQLAHGLDYVRQVNKTGQLTLIGTSGVWEEKHERDGLGQLTQRTPVGAGAIKAAYHYDPVGRLTGMASGTPGSRGYGYDASGNLLAQTLGAKLTRFTVDANSNRILFARTDGLVQSFAYNAAGSLTEAGAMRYTWDSQERLVKVSDASGTVAEYAYNPFGERIKKVVYSKGQQKVTYFLYDGSQLVAEAEPTDGASNITRQYVWLADQGGARPIALLQARANGISAMTGAALKAIPTDTTRAAGQAQRTDVFAIVTDHTGAPRAMVNDRKEVVWRGVVTGFGQTIVAAGAESGLNLRGSNQYFDQETQLHYNLRRYLDPVSGRYLSADPSGQAGGANLYVFAANNPVANVDPLGLRAKPVSGMDFTEKLKLVFEKAIPKVPGDVGAVLKDMVSPANLATTAGIFAVWGALQFTPFGWLADIAMVGLAYYALGSAAIDLIKGMIALIGGINGATCDADLDTEAGKLAKTIALVSVNAAAGALLKKTFGNTKAQANEVAPPQVGSPTLVVADAKKIWTWRGKALSTYDSLRRGMVGELEATVSLEARGFTPMGNTLRPNGIKNDANFESAFKKWVGQTGIDGIFKRVNPSTGKTEYWVVESKATGSMPKRDPCGTVGKLCNTAEGRQLSDDWLGLNLGKFGMGAAETDALRQAIKNGSIKKVYAQTTDAGTKFFEVANKGTNDVVIGAEVVF